MKAPKAFFVYIKRVPTLKGLIARLKQDIACELVLKYHSFRYRIGALCPEMFHQNVDLASRLKQTASEAHLTSDSLASIA